MLHGTSPNCPRKIAGNRGSDFKSESFAQLSRTFLPVPLIPAKFIVIQRQLTDIIYIYLDIR